MVRSLTVFTSNTSVKETEKPDDTNQFDRRVSGIKIKFDDGKEESIGLTDHHTTKEETYNLEEGELITEVNTHHPTALINKPGNSFENEVFSLTTIHDLSFETNKERRLGPMKESDLPLGIGLTMRVPSKIRHLEKNCPGKFCWLQGFGSEEIKISGSTEKKTLYPIWGFQTHFKVYSIKNQEFDFVAGIKKLYQFSIEGLNENPKIDDLEDIYQIERSPVHEVVDLEDSDSNAEEDSDGATQPGMFTNDDSIMVVDSDSEDEEDGEEEESDEETGYLGHGIMPIAEMGYGYPPMNFRPPINDGQGGEDEPIEIASSSDGEPPNMTDVEEDDKEKKEKTTKENSKVKDKKDSPTKDNKEEKKDKGNDKKDSLTEDNEGEKKDIEDSTTKDNEEEKKDKEKLDSGETDQPETPSKRSKRGKEKEIHTPTSKTKKGKVKKTPPKSKNESKEEEKKSDEKSSDGTDKESTKDEDTNKENSKENGDEVPDKKTRRKRGTESESDKPTEEVPEKKGRPKRGADTESEQSIQDTPGKKKKRGVK